ncbi:hypothetical protein ABK040_015202 [Willaertia magna]
MSENEMDDTKNNNNKRKRKYCKELVKKLKQDILQYDNNSLSTYFNFIQHYINKEIKNNPKNSSLLITKLPVEILINILQFLDFNNLFNFYKVCKDWYSLLFCNEYFWNLQYFNYLIIVENKKLENQNKKFKKNKKNKNLNENLKKINWKEKRNYLILKFNKYLNQLDLIKNKKYKFINIIFDLEDHESSYNEELNLLSDVKKNNNEINNETDLLFTKNTMFTKINVVTINRYEDDGGGLKCDGNVEGYFFYDKSPIFFKFILNFKVDYDVNGGNFLDLGDYRMGLLEKCLQIEDEEENEEDLEENQKENIQGEESEEEKSQ